MKNGRTNILLGIVVILLLLSWGYFALVKTKTTPLKDTLTSSQKSELAAAQPILADYDAKWATEISRLQKTKHEYQENSESFRLTTLLIETLETFKNEALQLTSSVSEVRDSISYSHFINELTETEGTWKGSKKLINEHYNLLKTFSLITGYQYKIDSLQEQLAENQNKPSFNASSITKLKSQIQAYEKKLEEIKNQGWKFKQENDSLKAELSLQSSAYDSLLQKVSDQSSMIEELKSSSKKNAQLATKLSLWYFEKDQKKKMKRRQLSQNKLDYNKGSEIKAIYGDFTLSAELFEPFSIATVTLINNEKEILAQAQISVRDQKSSEFVLIPAEKLNPNEYTVEVKYSKTVILQQNFHVSH